jgi:hypothetical protein
MAYPIIRPIVLYGAAQRRFDRLRERADRGYFRVERDPEEIASCKRVIDDYYERLRARDHAVG